MRVVVGCARSLCCCDAAFSIAVADAPSRLMLVAGCIEVSSRRRQEEASADNNRIRMTSRMNFLALQQPAQAGQRAKSGANAAGDDRRARHQLPGGTAASSSLSSTVAHLAAINSAAY